MGEGAVPIVIKNLFNLANNLDALPWQPFRKGVQIVRLYGNSVEGPSAALLLYEPGARIPSHRHTGYEHILVLSQGQSDENGTSLAGTLIINPPGSTHTVYSEKGTIVLAIWEKPVTFIESSDTEQTAGTSS